MPLYVAVQSLRPPYRPGVSVPVIRRLLPAPSTHRIHCISIHSYLAISTSGETLTFRSAAVRSRRGCGAAGGRAQPFLDALALSTIPPNAADNTVDIRTLSPPTAACGTSGITVPPAAVGSSRVVEHANDRTRINNRSLTPILASPSTCTSVHRAYMHYKLQ